jgi:hypothetical protein
MSKLTLLTDSLNESEIAIVQEALQDLYAKRVKAWRTSCQISYFNGHDDPDRSDFKIDEVGDLIAKLDFSPMINTEESKQSNRD